MNAPKKQKTFLQVGEEKPISLGREIFELLKHNKKYWMVPIFLILALFAVILILGSTSAAPFIYTLF